MQVHVSSNTRLVIYRVLFSYYCNTCISYTYAIQYRLSVLYFIISLLYTFIPYARVGKFRYFHLDRLICLACQAVLRVFSPGEQRTEARCPCGAEQGLAPRWSPRNEALEASLARSPRLDSCGRKCRERWHGVLCWHRFVESHPKEFLCVSLTWLIELIASYPSYSFTDQDEEQVSESRWNDFLKLVNSFLHAHRCVSGTDWKPHVAHMYGIATLCHIMSTIYSCF